MQLTFNKLGLSALSCLAAGAPALAAEAPAAAQPATIPATASPQPARVEIKGQQQDEMELRREQTAAKQIIGHEELIKYGDSSLVEALKRLPGISAGGAPGRGSEIRMHGLGNGYTLILINGEAPARGFPLDSISPDMVDKVEIIPASTAEYSAQGIAGTINLILKAKRPAAQNEGKLGATLDHGRLQPSASTQYSGDFSIGSYTLSAFANHYDQINDSTSLINDSDTAGVLRQRETDLVSSRREGTVSGFNPRIILTFGAADTVNILPLFFHRGGNEQTLTGSTYLMPAAGLVANAQQDSSSRTDSLRTTATWNHRMGSAGRLESKLGFNWNQGVANTLLRQTDTAGDPLMLRTDRDNIDDHGWLAGIKWLLPTMGPHMMLMGAESERNRHRQDSSTRYDGIPGIPSAPANLNSDIDLGIRRYAAFAQDEWQLAPQLSANAGLRWETLRIDSRVLGGTAIENDHNVFSPSLHLVWKLSPVRKDQVRASVTRSYKSPQVADLTPWTILSPRNSPTLPDRVGNPLLAPEVALGWDVAYERYVGKNGLLGVSGFTRHINDLIRRDVALQNGRWVSTPVNLDSARSSGVTLEAKLRLSELAAGWPGAEVHVNYSRYWSAVDRIAGPDNRLDEQPKHVLNAGADYSVPATAWTLGSNLSWSPAYQVQSALLESHSYGVKRGFDAYALWRFSPSANVRFSAGNLSHSDYLTGRVLDTESGTEQRNNIAHTTTSVGALLSLRF